MQQMPIDTAGILNAFRELEPDQGPDPLAYMPRDALFYGWLLQRHIFPPSIAGADAEYRIPFEWWRCCAGTDSDEVLQATLSQLYLFGIFQVFVRAAKRYRLNEEALRFLDNIFDQPPYSISRPLMAAGGGRSIRTGDITTSGLELIKNILNNFEVALPNQSASTNEPTQLAADLANGLRSYLRNGHGGYYADVPTPFSTTFPMDAASLRLEGGCTFHFCVIPSPGTPTNDVFHQQLAWIGATLGTQREFILIFSPCLNTTQAAVLDADARTVGMSPQYAVLLFNLLGKVIADRGGEAVARHLCEMFDGDARHSFEMSPSYLIERLRKAIKA